MAGEFISAEEARRLREAATKGQWYAARRAWSDIVATSHNGYVIAVMDCTGGTGQADAALMAAAPDLARTVDHLHAELAAEREAVLAFLLGMARTAETPQARGLIATIRRALELRYHRDPLRTPRDVEVSDD